MQCLLRFYPFSSSSFLVAGWETMRGAVAMFYMVQGFSRGLIKFVIITADK